MKMFKPLCIVIAAFILVSVVLVQEYNVLFTNEICSCISDQGGNEFILDMSAEYSGQPLKYYHATFNLQPTFYNNWEGQIHLDVSADANEIEAIIKFQKLGTDSHGKPVWQTVKTNREHSIRVGYTNVLNVYKNMIIPSDGTYRAQVVISTYDEKKDLLDTVTWTSEQIVHKK